MAQVTADVVRQLVSLAAAKGLLPGQQPTNGNGPTTDLGSSWRAMGSDADLNQGVLRAQGLVGLSQALIVYARELSALANGVA